MTRPFSWLATWAIALFACFTAAAGTSDPPGNDTCAGASLIEVNVDQAVNVLTPGVFDNATLSDTPLPDCSATMLSDLWFFFTASASDHLILLQNATQPYYDFAVYSGSCGSLTMVQCEPQTHNFIAHNLVPGQTYLLRVLTATVSPESSFLIGITVASSCENSTSVCGIQEYTNSTDVPSQGTVGCLFTTPNATFFNVHVEQSGSVNLLIRQSTYGSASPDLDVDYAAWGPFASLEESCAAISSGDVLSGPTAGCSYSAAPTENVSLPNAQAGAYYLLMVTNFSNQPGYIDISVLPTSTGSIYCDGIRMHAFVDTNANGALDAGELNFPLGDFDFEANGDGNVHHVTATNGHYTIYDQDAANTYDIGYTVHPDYAAYYASATVYTGVSPTAAGTGVFTFPITVTQAYDDLAVTLNPLTSPIAGGTYLLDVRYVNFGIQAIPSGNIIFDGPGAGFDLSTGEPGASIAGNTLTLPFTGLAPFETRHFVVTVNVPALPETYIGQLLTCTASGTAAISDAIAANDTATVTQEVVASYDPNDKIEAHGGKIAVDSFTADDYLTYTIRFENTGTLPAGNIVVTDKLDQKLNESTIEFVASSHPCSMEKLVRNLTFEFNSINLPVSVPGTDIGKGFVTFRVKPEFGYGPGTLIPNSAKIYFDVNPSITTNIWVTEFTTALSVSDFAADSFSMYPNPTRQVVHISSDSQLLKDISVFDIVGKKVKSLKMGTSTVDVDVSDLVRGVYLVEIVGDHSRSVKKLLVQ